MGGGKGRWEMGGGKWAVEKMGSGKWAVENGRWKIRRQCLASV